MSVPDAKARKRIEEAARRRSPGVAGRVTSRCRDLPCTFMLLGPAVVPGLSRYTYKIDADENKLSGTRWSVNKPTARIETGTGAAQAVVAFTNTKADWITVKACFKADGKTECAEKQVALVKVAFEKPMPTTPGKPRKAAPWFTCFLVNPPKPPATPDWVTRHNPGWQDWRFTYNGTKQADEMSVGLESARKDQDDAFMVCAFVRLTSPAEKPDALQKIEVGFIQHAEIGGWSVYGKKPSESRRVVRLPRVTALDWLARPPLPDTKWPWYATGDCPKTGSGTGTWRGLIAIADSPASRFPARYHPPDIRAPDPELTRGAHTFSFTLRTAVRTLETDLDADKHYFEHSAGSWRANFVWPLTSGVSCVTVNPAWVNAASPSEVDVHVVPGVIYGNAPFRREEHETP